MELLLADHTLDPDRRELHCGSEPIAVEPQVFDLLIHLIRNRDRVVSKDDLIASVWDGRIVSESTLTSRINAARKAIGDSGEEQKLIRTVARRGFRFLGEVLTQSNGGEPADTVGPPRDELRERSRPAVPPSDRPATEAIVAAIEPQLYARESFRAQRKPPDNMNAWDLVMRGLPHYWRVTRQDNVVAQALLEKAIAIDPNYGQALGVLATSYLFSFHMGWADRTTAVPIAERAALAAIQADSEDPWAHHALGCVYLFSRCFDDSLAEFELALRLNPNFSLAQGFYGLALTYCSRWEEADRAVRRALRLSPRDPFSSIFTGIAAYAQSVGRNYTEAMRLAREAIRQRSDFSGGYRVLAAAAGMAGHTEAAAAALQELRRAQPNISLAWIANEIPIMQGTELEHYLEAFRRAGLK